MHCYGDCHVASLVAMTDDPLFACADCVPEGITPPVKSMAFARLLPLPVTTRATPLLPVVLPERVTVRVSGVLPKLPSD
jgi:hypothetical protein